MHLSIESESNGQIRYSPSFASKHRREITVSVQRSITDEAARINWAILFAGFTAGTVDRDRRVEAAIKTRRVVRFVQEALMVSPADQSHNTTLGICR